MLFVNSTRTFANTTVYINYNRPSARAKTCPKVCASCIIFITKGDSWCFCPRPSPILVPGRPCRMHMYLKQHMYGNAPVSLDTPTFSFKLFSASTCLWAPVRVLVFLLISPKLQFRVEKSSKRSVKRSVPQEGDLRNYSLINIKTYIKRV